MTRKDQDNQTLGEKPGTSPLGFEIGSASHWRWALTGSIRHAREFHAAARLDRHNRYFLRDQRAFWLTRARDFKARLALVSSPQDKGVENG